MYLRREKDSFTVLMNLEKKCCALAVDVLECMKTVIEKFHGKVVDKRFEDAIREVTKVNFNIHVGFKTNEFYNYTTKQNEKTIMIEIFTQLTDSVKGNTIYPQYHRDPSVLFNLEPTGTGKYRLDKTIALTEIDKKISYYKNEIAEIENAEIGVDETIAEYHALIETIEQFQNKLGYKRELFNRIDTYGR